VTHIEQAGWHLLAMINDVLDLSRVERDQLALHLGAVDVAGLWSDLAALMSPPALRHGAQLRTAAVPPQAAVRADPVRLKQVLSNLVGNAIKYNRESGQVGFTVTAHGERWRLRFDDTGTGIAPQPLPHLYEAFNRLGREGSGVEGVGIGLVLTRRLVEQMEGEITLRSSLADGTTVTVELPRADGAQRISPAPSAAA